MDTFYQLLTSDPDAAIRQLQADTTVSTWLKHALTQLADRDPVDALHDLDLLLNLVEALCDTALAQQPRPHCRIRTLPSDSSTEHEVLIPPTVDQFPAELMIGGTVDRLLVPELLSIISESSVSLGWETPLFTPDSEVALFRALNTHHHLHFYNGFAAEGEFPSLEAWLIQHQIGFTRISSGTSAYQAERVQFRKGLKHPHAVAIDPNGQEFIPKPNLLKVSQYLKEGAHDDATALLDLLIGLPLGPLPPFRIAHTLTATPDFLHDEPL